MHTEERLLSRDLVGKCGVFWCQLESEKENFNLHLVTKMYIDGDPSTGKACWTMVSMTVKVIWRESRKVRVEVETSYGSDDQEVMVRKYL